MTIALSHSDAPPERLTYPDYITAPVNLAPSIAQPEINAVHDPDRSLRPRVDVVPDTIYNMPFELPEGLGKKQQEALMMGLMGMFMGHAGAIVRGLDRSAAHQQFAIMRASAFEIDPSTHPEILSPGSDALQSMSDNDMLTSQALRSSGSSQYIYTDGLSAGRPGVGYNRNADEGLLRMLDEVHKIFMQGGGFIGTEADAKGYVYIHGFENNDMADFVQALLENSTSPPALVTDEEGRARIVGVIPDGYDGAGEEVSIEVYTSTMSDLSKNATIQPERPHRLTGMAEREEGLERVRIEHGVEVEAGKKHPFLSPGTQLPFGFVVKQEQALNMEAGEAHTVKPLDRITAAQFACFEFVRRKGFIPHDPETQVTIRTLNMGGTLRELVTNLDAVNAQARVDPAHRANLNLSNAWVVMFRLMVEMEVNPAEPYRNLMIKIRDNVAFQDPEAVAKGEVRPDKPNKLGFKETMHERMLTAVISGCMIEALYPNLQHYPAVAKALEMSPDDAELYDDVRNKVARPAEAVFTVQQLIKFWDMKAQDGSDLVIDDDGVPRITTPAMTEDVCATILATAMISVEQSLFDVLPLTVATYGHENSWECLLRSGEAFERLGFDVGDREQFAGLLVERTGDVTAFLAIEEFDQENATRQNTLVNQIDANEKALIQLHNDTCPLSPVTTVDDLPTAMEPFNELAADVQQALQRLGIHENTYERNRKDYAEQMERLLEQRQELADIEQARAALLEARPHISRRHPESEGDLAAFREMTGMSVLIDAIREGTLLERLQQEDPDIIRAVCALREVGVVLQEHSEISSAKARQSNGVVEGLDLILEAFCPHKMGELSVCERVAIDASEEPDFAVEGSVNLADPAAIAASKMAKDGHSAEHTLH